MLVAGAGTPEVAGVAAVGGAIDGAAVAAAGTGATAGEGAADGTGFTAAGTGATGAVEERVRRVVRTA